MPSYKIENKKKFTGFMICSLLLIAILFISIFLGIKFLNKNNNKDKNMNNINSGDYQTENEKTEENNKEKTFREMAVAGQFYPSDKKELEKMIKSLMSDAIKIEGKAIFLPILVLPHAGYEFSGAVVAAGFKQIQNKEINRIVLLGRSHQSYFSGVSADTNNIWKTPLGDLEVDQDWIKTMTEKYDFMNQDEFVHQQEHSLEVLTPFIKEIFDNKIKIVPLLLGEDDGLDFQKIAQGFLDNIDNKTLFVISTDLSHYPEYQKAKNIDQKTIRAILTGNLEKFQDEMRELKLLEVGKNNVDTLACAEPAVAIAESLAEKLGAKGTLFRYANSGDFYPDTRGRVVGYAAIGFYSNKELKSLENSSEIDASIDASILNQDEQRKALEIARLTIENSFKNQDYNPDVAGMDIFKEKRGSFVTLKKDGQLRGCIGNFNPNKNLAENISEMARAAAFNDARFTPLQSNEFENIKIEISVLSPMQKINNPELVEVGKHGVYVHQGVNSGVFLPQVATEAGWNREEFLDNLCENKALHQPFKVLFSVTFDKTLYAKTIIYYSVY